MIARYQTELAICCTPSSNIASTLTWGTPRGMSDCVCHFSLFFMRRRHSYIISFLPAMRSATWSVVCTGYFILTIDQILYTITVSVFLSDSIRSVQLNMAFIKNGLDAYSPWSNAGSTFWDTETHHGKARCNHEYCLECPWSAPAAVWRALHVYKGCN